MQAVGQRRHPVVKFERAHRGVQLGVGRLRCGEAQVVCDGVGKQKRLLRHHRQPAAQIVVGDVLHIDGPDGDAPLRWVGQSRHQSSDGRFACT